MKVLWLCVLVAMIMSMVLAEGQRQRAVPWPEKGRPVAREATRIDGPGWPVWVYPEDSGR